MPSTLRYRRQLFTVLVLIAIVSMGGFLAILSSNPLPNSLVFEGAKVLPQIGLVSVAAAFVSYLVFEYQQASQRADKEDGLRREHHEARVGLLRGVASDLTVSYSDLKRTRRVLRACGTRDENGQRCLIVLEYDRGMAEIIDAQLRFEQMTQTFSGLKSEFSDSDLCLSNLRAIDRKLHEVIEEYESQRPSMTGQAVVPMEPMEKLGDFLARHSDDPDRFRKGFFPVTESLWKIRGVIRADIARSVGLTAREPDDAARTEELEWRYPRTVSRSTGT